MISPYDLARSVQGIDDLKLPAVSLGPVTAIPHKEQLPSWTERHSTLLWIILVLAVGTMFILIVRNLRKLPPPQKTS
jgi:bacteriorhodopsin